MVTDCQSALGTATEITVTIIKPGVTAVLNRERVSSAGARPSL